MNDILQNFKKEKKYIYDIILLLACSLVIILSEFIKFFCYICLLILFFKQFDRIEELKRERQKIIENKKRDQELKTNGPLVNVSNESNALAGGKEDPVKIYRILTQKNVLAEKKIEENKSKRGFFFFFF